jgi:hypothetical protein
MRLWRLVPAFDGDFNVPTPIAVDGKLLVSTENNGTRLLWGRFCQALFSLPVGARGSCVATAGGRWPRHAVFAIFKLPGETELGSAGEQPNKG